MFPQFPSPATFSAPPVPSVRSPCARLHRRRRYHRSPCVASRILAAGLLSSSSLPRASRPFGPHLNQRRWSLPLLPPPPPRSPSPAAAALSVFLPSDWRRSPLPAVPSAPPAMMPSSKMPWERLLGPGDQAVHGVDSRLPPPHSALLRLPSPAIGLPWRPSPVALPFCHRA